MSFRPLCLLVLVGCAGDATPPKSAVVAPVATVNAATATPPAPKSDGEKTVYDVALGSPDHTTLVAAVQATELVNALSSPGGIYTVFAPTNAAFDKLPPGTLDSLLTPEKKPDLKKIVQHHAAVPVVGLGDFKDGQVIGMSDGTSVTMHVTDGKVMVDSATILGSIHGMNGVDHVVDTVLLPPSR